MATNFLVHAKIWFDKFKYDDAERKFYEQMNGSVAGSSHQENVGPGGDHSELVIRIASLEVENQSLRGVVQDLQQAVSKLEAWLSALEKSSPTHPATAPQTQHVSPVHQVERPTQKAVTVTEDNEDEDDDIDLLGSDEQEDQEAAWLREERLQQYAEKKVKKPALVAKSSILLDIKPWDDEMDMAQLEACMRSIQLDGLTWGGGPPSWGPWATAPTSCRSSVWWRTTRWARTCWKRRSPSSRSMCRALTLLLSTRSEPWHWPERVKPCSQ
uniref:Elongation factor 1 beta central acidic region eukaryote domain-containing protein n=1 Tax=Monodon monoceros TaxID=40151 RepID=A0A8C6CL08_MONMO